MSEIPIDQFKACQDKPCWKCEATEGSKDKCMAHTLQPLFGRVYDMETKLEDYRQGQKEWEERAEKAEAKVAEFRKAAEKVLESPSSIDDLHLELKDEYKDLEKALSEGGGDDK